MIKKINTSKDEVVFRKLNSSNPSDIFLKHENPNNELVFNNQITFNLDTSHTTITLGAYQISVNNQDLVHQEWKHHIKTNPINLKLFNILLIYIMPNQYHYLSSKHSDNHADFNCDIPNGLRIMP